MGPENTLGLLMASAREQEIYAFTNRYDDGALAFSCYKTNHAGGPCHDGINAALAPYAPQITDLVRRMEADIEAKR